MKNGMRLLLPLVFLSVWPDFSVSAQRVYTIDTLKTYQIIHGFGASDAWSNELINLLQDSTRNTVADWLFSKETLSDGSCRGAGLSIWRYNLGTGSSGQGDDSGIPDPYRRTESIIDPGGTPHPERQSGTQWMLGAAKSRGMGNFVMFCNSPPVNLTINRKSFSGTCNQSNLSPVNHEAFADYIGNSLQWFENKGIRFNYISPVNEPEWGWCQRDGQEGNPYKNRQVAALVEQLNRNLISRDLHVQIQVPESGLLLFANPGFKFKPGRQNQIRSYFHTGRRTSLDNRKMVARQICAHSYFTEWPLWLSARVRKRLARVADRHDVEYWMTEYCILRSTHEITGSGRDPGMNTALYVSRVMHYDLVYGNASAWCWWLGLSSADYKDGLVYVNRDGTGLIDTKLLWAMGNFSRFILPGAIRIGVKGKPSEKQLVSAYRNPDLSLVVVVINMLPEETSLELKNLQGKFTTWVTSSENSLMNSGTWLAGDTLKIAPRSITTFVSVR